MSSKTRKEKKQDVALAAAQLRSAAFQKSTKQLPKIISAGDYLNNSTSEELLAIEASQVAPADVEHCVLPKGITRADGKTTKELIFMEKKLSKDTRYKILLMVWAKARGFTSIIQTADGYLAVPAYEITDTCFHDNSRTVVIKKSDEFDTLMIAIRNLVTSANVELTCSALKTICRSALALSPLKPDQIIEVTEAVDNIASCDLDELHELPDLIKRLLSFPKTSNLLTTLVGFRLSTFSCDEFIERMIELDLDKKVQIQALSLRPDLALPYIASSKHSLYLEDGSVADSVPISELNDDDNVLCTRSYITQAAIGQFYASTLVYTSQVYASEGKTGKNKTIVLAENPLSDIFCSGRFATYLSNLSKPAEPSKKRKASVVEDVVEEFEEDADLVV